MKMKEKDLSTWSTKNLKILAQNTFNFILSHKWVNSSEEDYYRKDLKKIEKELRKRKFKIQIVLKFKNIGD